MNINGFIDGERVDPHTLIQAKRISVALGYSVTEVYRALREGRTETQIVDARKRNLPAGGR